MRGVRALLDVASVVEAASTNSRLKFFDIGGGLSVNYLGDSVSPSFEDYATALLETCPELFANANIGALAKDGKTRWNIVSEFGKALISKTACVVSKVEDIIYHNKMDKYLPELDIELSGDGSAVQPLVTAVIHAGADLFLRQCYCPEKFVHRCSFVSSDFSIIQSRTVCKRVAVAGPLCFGGDVVQLAQAMPLPECGDFSVALDAGANTLSLFRYKCSTLLHVLLL